MLPAWPGNSGAAGPIYPPPRRRLPARCRVERVNRDECLIFLKLVPRVLESDEPLEVGLRTAWRDKVRQVESQIYSTASDVPMRGFHSTVWYARAELVGGNFFHKSAHTGRVHIQKEAEMIQALSATERVKGWPQGRNELNQGQEGERSGTYTRYDTVPAESRLSVRVCTSTPVDQLYQGQ